MGKQERKELMSKVYRQFSRQKYNKYKHQFPKMRESEIVSKIIKEWDQLDHVAKDSLQKLYEEKKFLTQDDISSSEALMKAEQSRKDALVAAKRAALTTQERPSNTRILAPSGPRSDSDYNRGSEQMADSKVASDSSKLIVAEPKSKKIGKPPKTAYIKFYKDHFVYHKKKHSRWGSDKISKIIKLEWKKYKQDRKVQKKERGVVNIKKRRFVSGRVFFRKTKGYNAIESSKKWKRFPFETKVHWRMEANEEEQSADLNKRISLPLKATIFHEPETSTSFSFMRKPIH